MRIKKCSKFLDWWQKNRLQMLSNLFLILILTNRRLRKTIAPLLPEYTRRYPNVTVHVETANRYLDLIDNNIDVAIRTREFEPDSNITIRRLAETRRILAASPGYLGRAGTPRALAERTQLVPELEAAFGSGRLDIPAMLERLERLQSSGFLLEVMKGWYIPARPDETQGESTAWYASFWAFCSSYLTVRFGSDWCLGPEQSLSLLTGDWTVPRQLLIRAPKGGNKPGKQKEPNRRRAPEPTP